MNKLLKMEFTSMKKEKLLWIGFIVSVAAILLLDLVFVFYRYINSITDYTYFAEVVFVSNLGIGGILGTISLIFIVIILLRNFQYGTIRSKITIGYSRTQIFLSYLIVCLTFGLGIYLINILFSLGLGILTFTGEIFVFSEIIKSIFYGLLINALAICFICFVAFSTASMWVTIIVTIAINMLTSVISSFFSLLSLLSDKSFTNFLPWVQINLIKLGYFEGLYWWHVVPVNVILSGLLIYFTILIFKHKDIK